MAFEARLSINVNSKNPESKQMANPKRNMIKHPHMVTIVRCFRIPGKASKNTDIQHSKLPHTDDMARRINMKKNMKENRGATSISATPSGYTTNARPGPAVMT